jgi:hypothetical protein
VSTPVVSPGYRQLRDSRIQGEGQDGVKTVVSVVGPQVGLSIGIF